MKLGGWRRAAWLGQRWSHHLLAPFSAAAAGIIPCYQVHRGEWLTEVLSTKRWGWLFMELQYLRVSNSAGLRRRKMELFTYIWSKCKYH